MNLENLANLGEFIGGIAVIASLIYLAIQIRQNTRSVKSSTIATNTANWSSLLVNLASGDRSEPYSHGILGMADISGIHFQQFALMSRAMLVSFESQHYQYLNGALDEDMYRGYERACKDQILAFPGHQMIWEITRDGFSPEFRKVVDRLISEVGEEDYFRMLQQWQELAGQRKAKHASHRPNL
jgi:hypothetical protein